MVSKAQQKLLRELQVLITSQKWVEARKLILSSDDFLHLAFIKIFVGIETDDEQLVSDGILKAKKILSKPDKVVHLSGAYYNLGNAYQYLVRKFLLSNKTYFGAETTARDCIKNFGKSLSITRDEKAFVNLGNFYDEIGRPLEALSEYEKAININPGFGMAVANKAQALETLAIISSYSTGYLIYAYQLYQEAFKYTDSILDVAGEKAVQQFQTRKDNIEDYFKKNSKTELLAKNLSHKKFSRKGLSRDEISYTQFCLSNNLYLNLHIFDLHSAASVGDTVSTSFITSIKDGDAEKWVKEISMRLNEIKESFITGRYLLWKSQQKSKSLSSISKQSLLVNNLDYTAHNIYTGLLKSSYKEVFSVLDKIANTINFYLGLGNAEHDINYRNIWYENLDKDQGFSHKVLRQSYRLFGIFSIIDELGAKPAGIRNSLEHTYQRIGTIGMDKYNAPTFEEFTGDTIGVYYKIKCTIVYLLNFINSCEGKKRAAILKKGGILPTVPLITDQWLDLW